VVSDCTQTFEDSLILYGRDTRVCLLPSILSGHRIPEQVCSFNSWSFINCRSCWQIQQTAGVETVPEEGWARTLCYEELML
jgi:hypothetical protein